MVTERVPSPDLSAPHLCQCDDCQRIYREHLARKEPHPRVCPNGLDCPCYDKPWVAPETAPAREQSPTEREE